MLISEEDFFEHVNDFTMQLGVIFAAMSQRRTRQLLKDIFLDQHRARNEQSWGFSPVSHKLLLL
jgi:hypothetical protein